MSESLAEKIKDAYPGLTKSEKVIAAHLLENLTSLPFETLTTIARTCNVSDMTVARFVRSLGYRNLNEIKEDMHSHARHGQVDLDDMSKRRVAYFKDDTGLRQSLEKEVMSLVDVYALCETKLWHEVVDLIATRKRVYVIGFQAAMGIAIDFSTALKYVRPGVRYLDDRSGVYMDLLENDPEETCLVVVDTALYSEAGKRLVVLASAKGFPVVFISDKYGSWQLDYTKYLLRASSDASTYWDSRVAISAIANLLQHFVANALGQLPSDRTDMSLTLNKEIGTFIT